MTEFIDRMDNLEGLCFDDPARISNPFTPAKLIGVAALGAATALSVYYIYSSLDPEKKEKINDKVVSYAKEQLSSLTKGCE